MKPRILVTGGCGFIGSHLCRRILKEGYKPVIFDTMLTGSADNLGDAVSQCSFVRGRVTNRDALARAMSGVSVVYHLAARNDISDRPYHNAAIFTTNVMGTVWVLTQARNLGVHKVVIASAADVYGNVVPGQVGGLLRPDSVFGASKRAAEIVCDSFAQVGMEIVVLRLYDVYGPGSHSIVDRFKAGSRVIYGDGSQTRDFIHVDDVVAALWRARRWDSGIYNVGTGIETTVLGLYNLIHTDEPDFQPVPEGDLYRSCSDKSVSTSLRKLEDYL